MLRDERLGKWEVASLRIRLSTSPEELKKRRSASLQCWMISWYGDHVGCLIVTLRTDVLRQRSAALRCLILISSFYTSATPSLY